MAIEFGSRKETFENYKVYETMLAGRPKSGVAKNERTNPHRRAGK